MKFDLQKSLQSFWFTISILEFFDAEFNLLFNGPLQSPFDDDTGREDMNMTPG